MPHGKAACERLSTVTVTAPTADEARQSAVQARLISEDTELSTSVRAEATLLYLDLAASPTAEDAARRMALMQRAARLGRTNS